MNFLKNIKLKLKYKNIIKKCLWIVSLVFLLLYLIAFVMKDYANNNNVKKICQEFVNGPRNIVALMINKISPNIMSYKTNINMEINDKKSGISIEERSLQSIVKEINKQKEIDKNIKREIENNKYALDDPLIIQNPYDISPLTALVIYDSDKPELASIKIKGKTNDENIEFIFKKQGYVTKHVLPIMGLYPNMENECIITSIDESGIKKEKSIKIYTEDLIDDLKNVNFNIYKGDMHLYQKGLNFSYMSIDEKGIKMAFDSNGDIRWYFSNISLMPGNFNFGKSIYTVYGTYFWGDTIICEQNYLGKILNVYYTPYGVNHDIYLTNHNTMLLTGSHKNTYDDMVNEIDLMNNDYLYNIDYRKLLPRDRKQIWIASNEHPWGYNYKLPQDWMHMNSVVEYNNDVIVSSNYQSAIMRNSKEGKIKWILADPRDFTTYWQQYLLKPIGNDFEYPYNQHAVEILPDYDHNPDTIDILLFDNGSSRFLVNEELQKNIKLGKAVEPKLYSRLVHYRIDEKNMTVEQIWQYGKERPELFSPTRGDADLLDNGNVLGTFNRDFGIYKNSIYIELTSNKDIIWECYATSNLTSNNYFDYRLERLPIYNDDNDYMDIEKEMNNFAPMEVLKKYGYQN